jgi:hypothetical protein
MWLLLIGMHTLFILYFLTVWSWVAALLPLLVMSIYVLNIWEFFDTDRIKRQDFHQLVLTYALPIAWIAIIIWLQWISSLYYTGFEVWWLLIIMHIVMRLGSYILQYNDGKIIFQLWYFVSVIWFLITLSGLIGIVNSLFISMALIVVSALLYGAIIFLLSPVLTITWRMRDVFGKSESILLFFLGNLSLLFGIYAYARDSLALAMVFAQLYVMALYCVVYFVTRYADSVEVRDWQEFDVLHHVLSWKKLLWQRQPLTLDLLVDASRFIRSLDRPSQAFLSLLNIVVMIVLVIVFFEPLTIRPLWFHEVMFWFSIVCFFVNYMLLRVLWWYHTIQRVVAFFLITFGVYLTVMHIFGQSEIYLLLFGVIRSVVNSMIIFHTNHLWLDRYFDTTDYRYRIGSTLLATLFNMYFLTRLPLWWQVIFSLLCLYLWVQWVLTRYNIRHVSQYITQRNNLT